jgi:hypothetical protein
MHILNEQSIPHSRLLRWLEAAVVIGCALFTVSIIGWSIPRGLDIADESFYMLNYRYPNEYAASFSNFHLLVTRGFGLVDCSLPTYRWLGLLVNILGTVVFGLSFAHWQRTTSPNSSKPTVITICFVVLGGLLIYSIFPRALSYNSINSVLLLLGAAAVLQALRYGPSGSLWLLAAGVSVGLDVFVKPSTALLVVCSETLLIISCWKRYGIKSIAIGIILLGLGVAAGLAFYFLRVQPPLVWYQHLVVEAAVIQNGSGYGTKQLLLSYITAAGRTIQFILYRLGPTILLLLGLAWWWPRQSLSNSKRLRVAFALALLIALGLYTAKQALRYQWYTHAYIWNDCQSLPLLLAILVLAAGILFVLPKTIINISNSSKFSQLILVGCWLFALPFLAAAGTANDLRFNLLIDAGPWFALLLLLTGLYLHRLPSWVVSVLLLLTAGFAVDQVLWGTLVEPFGLRQSISSQVVPLQTAGLKTPILVDSATATFFKQFTQLLAKGGFQPGDPIMAFYDAPGMIYVSGGISPGMPWYFINRDVSNCHALDLTRLSISKAYIVATRPLDSNTQKCLRAKGLNFPYQYKLIGILINPYSNILDKYHTVSVYAPL